MGSRNHSEGYPDRPPRPAMRGMDDCRVRSPLLLRSGLSDSRLERRHDGGGDGPDEGGKLPRYGDSDDGGRLAGTQQAPVTGAQPDLRPPGHILDGFGQRPVASKEFEADASRQPVGPRTLHQYPPGAAVAGFGDRAAYRSGTG